MNEALQIMGMGMLGIFTAMIIIMLITSLFNLIDKKFPSSDK